MVRGMKVGSHVNLSPTQVKFFSIKTKPYRGCEKMKMSLDVQNSITAIRSKFSERVPCSKFETDRKVKNLRGASFS